MLGEVKNVEKTTLFVSTYNFSLFHIIKEDEITEHCYEAEKPKTCHDVDNCVLQVKFPCNNCNYPFFYFIKSN